MSSQTRRSESLLGTTNPREARLSLLVIAPATQTTVVSLSSAAKSTVLNRTPLASPPLASPVVSKFVGNDASVSTSSSPKRSSQVARTIAPATQTAAASLSSAEKSTVLNVTSLSSLASLSS